MNSESTSTQSTANTELCMSKCTFVSVEGISKYGVCEHGTVVNLKQNRVLKGTIKDNGYRFYYPKTDEGKYRKMSGHRLVALAFLPNPQHKPEVDHKDRCKLNNQVSNLRWSTRSENLINKGMPTRKNKGDGFRHISKVLRKYEYYRLEIRRNNKNIVDKHYRTDQYTIDQVVKLRNDFYKINDIAIEDE